MMKTISVWKQELADGVHASRLASLYCCPAAETAAQAARYSALLEGLENTFGAHTEAALYSAPGRTEIGGNHTDHQHGRVIAGSVNIDMIAAAAPNSLNQLRVQSEGTSVELEAEDAPSDDADGSSKKSSSAAEVYVDVDGAVASPGVYRLKDGARVSQAIDAAGGLTPEADVTGLNRASKVADGQKIYVPTVGEQQAAAVTSGADSGASPTSGAGASSGLVNINTASAAELQTLSGIGPSMAQSIIDERTQNGAFASVDDLMRVSGIGEKKLAKIKDCICV